MDGVQFKEIGNLSYKELHYSYRWELDMQEASRRRRAWANQKSFQLLAAPDFISDDSLGENDIVVGTEGIASQFSPEHFLILPLKQDVVRNAHALDFYVLNHPEKNFLLTKVFCGMAGKTPENVAPYFAPFLWYGNVRMPAAFIDVLANNQHFITMKGGTLSPEQNAALYKWRNERKVLRIQAQYGDIFSVLGKDRIGEVSRMICAADDGEYMSVEFINTIRNALQDFFSSLHSYGLILKTSDRISECGKEISFMHEIPDHVRSFTFSLIGIVNGGSHPNYYRRAIGQGDYKNLLKSLTYMLISIIEWWAAGFPMLEEEDIKRPVKTRTEPF